MEALSTKELLGSRIREAREAIEMTPAELSRKIGISRAAVSQWEMGITEPSAANLRKVAKVLNLSLEWLGIGRSSSAIWAGDVMADGELVDLKKLDPGTSKLLRAAIGDKKDAEVWRLTSSILAGAGYQAGDYLVVDIAATPRARDIVLATSGSVPIFRAFFPPYLHALPVAQPPAAVVVDKIQVVVKGVVVSRFSLS